MLRRFIKWHIAGRLAPGDVAVEWVNGARFLARPWHYGFSANVYCGFLEFNDMAFVLHALRPEDLFVDIGANRGSYTVLAGAAVGARVIAIEPIPNTFDHLQKNVCLNNLTQSVECRNIGLGENQDVLTFTADASDCVNHVVAEGERTTQTVSVPVEPLDHVVQEKAPFLIKLDVEGYEWFVLQGGMKTLSQSILHAIIIELNNSGMDRHGISDQAIDGLLRSQGFLPVDYDPFSRRITPFDPFEGTRAGNVVYIRNPQEVESRLKDGHAFSIFGKQI